MRSHMSILMVLSGLLLLLSVMALSAPAEAARFGTSLGFDTPGNERTFVPPDPVVFDLTVEHTGTELTQTTVVEILNEPAGWSHNLVAVTDAGTDAGTDDVEFQLAVGEVATLTVTIMPAPGMANRTYWLTVWAYPRDDISADDSVDLGVVITRAVDFEVVLWDGPPSDTFTVTPPGEVDMRFAVFNLGNTDDGFRIQVTSNLLVLGWVPVITAGVDGLGWTPDLPADPGRASPHLVDVRVSVPGGAEASTKCYVTLNATSKTEPSLARPPAGATIRVLQKYGFQVEVVGPSLLEAPVGGTAEFRLRITNTGNGDDTFRIFAAWDEDALPGWLARVNPAEIIIAPASNDTTDYTVKLPANASLGTYAFHAEVWSSSVELTPVSRTLRVSVANNYDLLAWADEEELTAGPGEKVVFDVSVRNVGNALDSYNLSLEDAPEGWVTFLQPDSLTLSPDETGRMNVTMLVPADLGGSPRPTYTFDLVVGSVKGPAVGTVTLSVHIESFGRVEWLLSGEPVTSPGTPVAPPGTVRPKPVIDVYQGTTAALTLHLRNTGIMEDNVTLWAWTDDVRVTVTVLPEWKVLQPGADLEVYVQVSVPDDLFPGEHRLWVNASSSDGREAVRAVPVEFDLVPYYDTIDFQDLQWSDLLDDDFTYTYLSEGNEVVSASGRRGRSDELDMVSLTGLLDLETNVVTVTMELKGAPVTGAGVFYGVYFVSGDHQVVGGLADPESHRRGDFVWESHDEDNTIAFVYLSDNLMGSSVPMNDLDVSLGSDRVVFTLHARDLRKAGVDPGSDFRLYGYCHRLGSPGDDGKGARLVYDTAGQGSIDAPREFTREPPEEASYWWVGVVVAMAVALAVVFLYLLPRLLPPEPEEEPEEADDWVEY